MGGPAGRPGRPSRPRRLFQNRVLAEPPDRSAAAAVRRSDGRGGHGRRGGRLGARALQGGH